MDEGSGMTDRDRDSLKIGDLITLKSVLRDGYLSAEGILADYIYLQSDLSLFDECIFMVQLQRQYCASSELDRYLSTYIQTDEEDDNTEKYIKALERGRNNETMLNESYMKQKVGQAVMFGDIVQLRHMKSGKFLNILSNQVANDERENLTVLLDDQGSPYSWLEVAPRYKIDRVGDIVQTNTEVYLKVAERKNEYVHAADRHITVQRPREVNCSLEPTSWRVSIFTSSVDFSDSTLLLASEMVSIYDAETKSYLTILMRDAGCLTGDDDDDDSDDGKSIQSRQVQVAVVEQPQSQPLPPSALAGIVKKPDGRQLSTHNSKDSNDSEYDGLTDLQRGQRSPNYPKSPASNPMSGHGSIAGDEIQFMNGVCEVVIRPSEGALDSNAVWVMESELLIKGGPVEWKTQQVRFKNLNTGLYLIVDELQRYVERKVVDESQSYYSEAATSRVLETYMSFTTTEDREDPRTLLFAQEIYSVRPELSVSKPVQLFSSQVTTVSNMWVGRGDQILVEDGNNKVSSYYLTKFGFEKNNAISFLINRYHPSDMASKELSSLDNEIDEPSMPMDVHTGVALRVFFEKYLSHTVVPEKLHRIPTFWPKLVRADMTLFETVTEKCCNFAKGFHISTEVKEGMKPSPAVRQKRQNLLKEQGVLEVLLQIIHKLIPLSKKMDDLIRDSAPMDDLSDPVKLLFSMSTAVLGLCLNIIYNSIVDNTETQLYVANFMPILLSHLNSHPLAGNCVTEMLNNNMELQETKIGNREINIFVDKLKESKYNGMYLRLLQSCCSCQGDGVDGNQRKIVLRILADTKDCFLTVSADYKKSNFMKWNTSGSNMEEDIYIPQKLLNQAEEMEVDAQEAGRMNNSIGDLASFQDQGGWASAVPTRQSSFKGAGIAMVSMGGAAASSGVGTAGGGTGSGSARPGSMRARGDSLGGGSAGRARGDSIGGGSGGRARGDSMSGMNSNSTSPAASPIPFGNTRSPSFRGTTPKLDVPISALMKRTKSFLSVNTAAPIAPSLANLGALRQRSPSDRSFLDLDVAPVKGDKIITEGVPRVCVTWESSNVKFSPQGMFNKLQVPLEELFPVALMSSPVGTAPMSVGKNRRQTSMLGTRDEQRKKIADYFVAEMYLGAELCMDQNYVSMLKLDDFFPYETLLAMLRLRVHDDIKAAAARLIHFLYVDRYPNSKIPVPRLSRSWTDVTENPIPSLPNVSDEHANMFAILQHLVSEHVKGMKGVRWTPLSLHMLRVLNCMLNFNFYGSRDKLRDVIYPLIEALDRRNVQEVAIEFNTKSRMNTPGKAGRRESLAAMKMLKENSQSGIDGTPDDSKSKVKDCSGDNSMENVSSSSSQLIATSGAGSELSIPGPPVKVIKWEKKLLDFMNSIPVMLAVLSVVIVAVAEVFWVVSFGADNGPDTPLHTFEIIVATFFVVEISIRAFAYFRVHGQLGQFFKNTYNQIDCLVILIDIVFLSLPAGLMSGGGIVKILRLARLFRLLRLAKAAKVATAINVSKKIKKVVWTLPARFTKLPAHELEAMVEAASVLVNAQNRIDDRNISLYLRYFYLWQSGQDTRSMSAIFDQIMQEYTEVSLETNESDSILLDLLLFSDPKLIQSILEVFMAIYSARRMFLVNARNIQLIVSSKREQQFKQISLWVAELDRTVETQELWGDLVTKEDRENSDIIWRVMNGLVEVLCTKRYVLEFDQFYKADRDVQAILRNVGFFDTIMKVINLLERVDEEELPEGSTAMDIESLGGSCVIGTSGDHVIMSEGSQNTLAQVKLANKLLYWFLYRNKENQDQGYNEIEFFMETLSKGINSHLVIKSMFEYNEKVCKQCPFETTEFMAQLICKEGHRHYYLTLLEAITHAGEKHIIENQFQVVKVLTNPDIVSDIVKYFVPVKSPEYKEKVELMKPFLTVKDVDIEILPGPIKYHISLLDTLSSCTISNSNMATIEAKAQALYFYFDIVKALLDPKTLLLVKIKLGMFFFNSTIDVEMSIPGLDHSAAVWNLIQSFPNIFVLARDELRVIEKLGWEAPQVSRQNIEYMLVCVRITSSFFKNYYNPLTFRCDDIAANAGDAMKLTMPKINLIIGNLFSKLSELYETDSPRLAKVHKKWIYDAMCTVNKSASSVIVVHIENTHDVKHSINQKSTPGGGGGEHDDEEGEEEEESEFAKTAAEVQISNNYNQYMFEMESDSVVQASIAQESFKFIDMIEQLPKVDDTEARSDVRYEAILKKLTSHCRGCFKIVRGEKNLDAATSRVILWLLGVFLTMIEKRWGMTLDEREQCKENGTQFEALAQEVIESLDSCGVTMLCLDSIAVGIDSEVQIAAVKLLTALLVKDGGSMTMQLSVHSYLTTNRTDLFFKQIRKSCNELIEWHRWTARTTAGSSKSGLLYYIRFLQLLSVGHNSDNQELLRTQHGEGYAKINSESVILLDDFVNYLTVLSKLPSVINTRAACEVVFLILTTIQGPCEENQNHFALNTQLLETLNRLMRAKAFPGCVQDDELELKILTIGCFQGLLEGQGSKRAVYEKFLGVIHLDILQLLCEDPKNAPKKKIAIPPPPPPGSAMVVASASSTSSGNGMKAASVSPLQVTDKQATVGESEQPLLSTDGTTGVEMVPLRSDNPTKATDESQTAVQAPIAEVSNVETEKAKDLRIKAIVLLRSLMDYDPTVQELLGLTDKDTVKLIGDQTASIEIVWRGELQRRFFRIPDLCRHLASSSRNAFVEEADRSTIENKLLDFFDRAKVLYREIVHQEIMTKMGIAKVFSKQNYDRSTWSAFFLAVLVNFLFICLYRAPNGVDPFVAPAAKSAIFALNIFQIALAAFNVIINIVVRGPVIYQGYIADGESELVAILNTAQDPMTMYYFVYTILAVVGAFDNIFLIFLLFDIVVKNSTVRDILNSVVIPRYQLGMAGLLGAFVIYILVFFTFYFYNDNILPPYSCVTLWECFKLGLRAMATDGGLGELMIDDIGIRIFLTMAYFFGVMIVLLNIIFGITIDTFGALREAKNERLEDTENVCFICGLDNLVFDRIERDGFESHIRQDHYMWNYFYFITYIWEQNKDKDDGFEGFVRHCVEKSDISWFPINKALRLRSTKSAKDVLKGALKQELKKTEGSMLTFWSKLEHEARDKFLLFKNVLSAIQNDGSNGSSHNGGASVSGSDYKSTRMNSNANTSPAVSAAITRINSMRPLEVNTKQNSFNSDSGMSRTSSGGNSRTGNTGVAGGPLPVPPALRSTHAASSTADNYDVSLHVVEVSGDKLLRMIKNTLTAQGHVLTPALINHGVDVFFECTVTCPNVRPQSSGVAGASSSADPSRVHVIRTSVILQEDSTFDIVFPPSVLTIGRGVSVNMFGSAVCNFVISFGAYRPDKLMQLQELQESGEMNLQPFTDADRDMMDIASWDVTVNDLITNAQIVKSFPQPYASCSLIVESICKRSN